MASKNPKKAKGPSRKPRRFKSDVQLRKYIFSYLNDSDIDPVQNVRAMQRAYVWIKFGLQMPNGTTKRRSNVIPFERRVG